VINNYDGSGNEVRRKMWKLLGSVVNQVKTKKVYFKLSKT
jgi:hypothetical protein